MSNIYFPREGLLGILGDGGPLVATYRVGLYVGPAVIDADIVLADILPATFGGYAPVDASGWTAPAATGSGPAVTVANPVVFVATGAGLPQTVLGSYVWHVPTGTLRWIAPDPAGGFVVNVLGASYTVVPRLELGNIP